MQVPSNYISSSLSGHLPLLSQVYKQGAPEAEEPENQPLAGPQHCAPPFLLANLKLIGKNNNKIV